MSVDTCAGSALNALSVAERMVKYDRRIRLISYSEKYSVKTSAGLRICELKRRTNNLSRYFIHLFNGLIILFYLLSGYRFVVYGVPHCRSLIFLFCRFFDRPVILRSTMLGDDDLVSIKKNLPLTWFGLQGKNVVYWAINPEFQRIGQKHNKIETLYLSQGCRFMLSYEDKIRIKHHKPLSFLSVGHLVYRKGYGDLLKILKVLELDLTIIGHNSSTATDSLSEYKDEMIELANLLKHEAQLLGPQENIQDYFKSNQILLHFAIQEGLPNVVIEAMAHGCIPIVRRLPGIEDFLIENKNNGFLFDNIEEAIQIIREIDNNEYNLAEISKNAMSTVNARFSIQNTADVLVQNLFNV